MEGAENGGKGPPSPAWGVNGGIGDDAEMRSPGVYFSAVKQTYAELKVRAYEMRLNPTPAERALWELLRDNKLGVRFRRQHILLHYIADFYCFEHNLIIELDGKIHDHQKDRDSYREEVLKTLGCKILRFKNEEVLTDPSVVISTIINIFTPHAGERGPLQNPKHLRKSKKYDKLTEITL